MVFAKGICCADDSFHAHVAKNLANGLGFSSTVNLGEAQYSVRLFDPLLGTGPAVILPAALVIKLVGAAYWAPGAAAVGIWSLLLVAIAFTVLRLFGNPGGMALAAVTIFSFFFLFFIYHFEQWYALLGEIPSAFLIVLAVLVYFRRESKWNFFLAGVFFALAGLSKIVSVLMFGAFCLFVFLVQAAQYRRDRKTMARTIVGVFGPMLAGFATPFLLFELWKFTSLGLAGYRNYWAQWLDYIAEDGVSANSGVLATLVDRIGLVKNRFGFFLPAAWIVLIAVGWVLRTERKLFQVFAALVFLAAVYSVYWIYLSIGWPRYFIIGLVIIIFAFGLPFLSQQRRMEWKVIYAAVMIFFAVFASRNYNVFFPFENIRLYQPGAQMLALLDLNDLLAPQLEMKPFLTQGWAASADIEYILPASLNFTSEWDSDFRFDRPFLIAANSQFLSASDARFEQITAACDVRMVGVYLYAECPQQAVP